MRYTKLVPLCSVKSSNAADKRVRAARQDRVSHFAVRSRNSGQMIAQMIGRKILKKGKFCTNDILHLLLLGYMHQVKNNLETIKTTAKNAPIETHMVLKLKSISCMRFSKTLVFT